MTDNSVNERMLVFFARVVLKRQAMKTLNKLENMESILSKLIVNDN